MPAIELSIRKSAAILTVNRPEVRNALNLEAMREFAAAIEQAHRMTDLAALVITGAGKAFIAGGDLNELHTKGDEQEARRMTTLMGKALNRLADLPCITMAAMEGPTRGGGCEIALACDWRVAAEDADMGFVQIRLALTTGWGGADRLQKIVGYARALDLLTLGRVITAAEAYRLGLVTHLTPPDEALNSALHIADSLALYDRAAVRAYKRILQSARTRPQAEAQAVERAEFAKLWAAEAHQKAVLDFLRKANP